MATWHDEQCRILGSAFGLCSDRWCKAQYLAVNEGERRCSYGSGGDCAPFGGAGIVVLMDAALDGGAVMATEVPAVTALATASSPRGDPGGDSAL